MHVEVKEGAEQLRPPGEFGMCPVSTPHWLRVKVNNWGRRYRPLPVLSHGAHFNTPPLPLAPPTARQPLHSTGTPPASMAPLLHRNILFQVSKNFNSIQYIDLSHRNIKWKSYPFLKNPKANRQSSYIRHICWEGGENFTDNKKTTGNGGPRWAEQKRNTWFAKAKSSSSAVSKRCPLIVTVFISKNKIQ